MKNRILKFTILFALFIAILMIGNGVNAASSDISVNKKEINVGDNVTVTIKVNAAQWDLTLNASGLKYVSGTTRFTELDNANGNLSKSATAIYKAEKAGTFSIKMTGDITDISGDNSDQSKIVDITVKEKVENTTNSTTPSTPVTPSNPTTPSTEQPTTTAVKKSNNANLSTLGVTPKEYDFTGFKKNTTNYSVTVPSDVDSLKVVYKTEDSKATVKVSGNTGFNVGSDNKIKIIVTAEDGKTTKTYIIKVTKLAEDEEKPGNLIEDDSKKDSLYLTSLMIKGIELSPKFSKDIYSYTATLNDNKVEKLTIQAVSNNEKANIDITGNEQLSEGENLINIILTIEGSSDQVVYQVTVNKEAEIVTSTQNSASSNTDLMGSIKNFIWIAIVVVALIILAIIILIILIRKESKKLSENENDSQFEKDDIGLKNKDKNKEMLERINKSMDIDEEYDVQGQSVEFETDDNDFVDEKEKRKGRHF